MKKILVGGSFIMLLTTMAAFGQTKPITQKEYEEALKHASDMTEKANPCAGKYEEEKFRDNVQIEKGTFSTEVVSEDRFRATMQIVSNGRTSNLSEIGLGIGDVYCKVGDGKWKLESESGSACHDAWNFIPTPSSPGPEDAATFTSEEKTIGGQRVKIYREYVVYDGKRTFLERIDTVDSKGFLTVRTTTEGTLDPRTVTVKVKYSWTLNVKIAPIIRPKE